MFIHCMYLENFVERSRLATYSSISAAIGVGTMGAVGAAALRVFRQWV